MKEIFVDGLTKKYTRNIGIFDISLEVDKGEVFGYLGPNGAGKTTTIRHLMGFCRPDFGKVFIKGMESYKKYNEILKSVGYLPGEISLPSALSGWEFIRMMQSLRKDKNTERLNYLLDKFELDPNITKRKLAIVTAFMSDPDILILDEPTSGLDPLGQEKFISFIKEEKKRGKTIFLSSHIFSEVDATCDRIAIIKDGRIVSTFVADDLKHNKNKTYLLDFLSLYDLDKFLSLSFDIAHIDKEKLTVKFCINDEDINTFISATSDINYTNFREVVFSLEDYFMQFYKEDKVFGGINK
jgi:ABC-2 type transport system ATP-binding protein